jgi:hypothetical protein
MPGTENAVAGGLPARRLRRTGSRPTIGGIVFAALVTQAVAGQTTLPRHRDADPVEQRSTPESQPTDPYFDRKFVATDDAAFVLSAVESTRQSAVDASTAETALRKAALRNAAKVIGRHNEETRARLESIAKRKGWRLPDHNPDRATTLPKTGETRAAANFIVNQISFHENTVAQFEAQLAGNGDAELKRELRASLPGFRKNLDLLLQLKL